MITRKPDGSFDQPQIEENIFRAIKIGIREGLELFAKDLLIKSGVGNIQNFLEEIVQCSFEAGIVIGLQEDEIRHDIKKLDFDKSRPSEILEKEILILLTSHVRRCRLIIEHKFTEK